MAFVRPLSWIVKEKAETRPSGLIRRLLPYAHAQANAARIVWVLVGIYALAVVLAFWAAGLGLSYAGGWRAVALFPVAAFIAWFYRKVRPDPWLSYGAEALFCLGAILLMGTLLSFAAATIGGRFPLRDAWLADADEMLGFHWRSYLDFINARPLVGFAFQLIYSGMDPQFLVIVGVLILRGELTRLQTFIISTAVALLVTIAIFVFMPATCYFAILHLQPADYANLQPTVMTGSFMRLITELRTAGAHTVYLNNLEGLIAFPSFHAVAVVLFVWSIWPVRVLRWWILLLNVLIIATTPIEGAHYLVDVIAGLLLGVAAIAVGKRLSSFVPRGIALGAPASDAAQRLAQGADRFR